MRTKLILPIVLGILLGACSAATCSANSACLDGALRYTNGSEDSAQPTRTAQVAIDREIDLYERARIFRAVNEWNAVPDNRIYLPALKRTLAFAVGSRDNRRHIDKVAAHAGGDQPSSFQVEGIGATTMHILLIEDDGALRAEILEYMLRRRYRVTACGTIAEADSALDGAMPDAVLSDIQLPDGDGVTFYVNNVRRAVDARWILMSGNHDLVRLGNQLKAVADLPPCSIIDKPVPLRLLDLALRGAGPSN